MSKGGAWNGKPVQRGNWGTWAQIEYGKGNRQSCYSCLHCSDGFSCDLKSVVISEIGKGFWRQCDSYKRATEDDVSSKKRDVPQTENARVEQDAIPFYSLDEQKNIGNRLIGKRVITKKGKRGRIVKITHQQITVLLENNTQCKYIYPICFNGGEIRLV